VKFPGPTRQKRRSQPRRHIYPCPQYPNTDHRFKFVGACNEVPIADIVSFRHRVVHSITSSAIIAPLARVAEVRALRRTATNLLDTYVGNQAGERILAGAIRRGHADVIYAAIWLSDVREFALLADRVRPQTVVGLLNDYFDCQVPAILKHGGEVLKFMGG
jgi:class 3 adenylate cyclase